MYALSEWLFRAVLVNVLWIVGTLAGVVVLGIAPATMAAHHLARQYARGTDDHAVRTFARCYRQEFWRANALLVPPALLVAAALAGALVLRGSSVPGAGVLVVGPVLVAACVGLALLYLPSLAVHYEVPTVRALSRAFLFAVANLPSTLLLAAVLAATVYASMRLPGLLPVVSVGAWVCGSTALCLRFYAQNDDALERASAGPPSAVVPESAIGTAGTPADRHRPSRTGRPVLAHNR
ncbi:hypothetical protein GCM10023169_28060 [Georgenia halophila]|uniref:Membrane protein YesL n=2 Tax=Georgenia halophila TaxID=620889 RepID=A0ABP8LF43_9MICO